MATFSVNQVRHLYVAKTLKSGNNLLPSDAAGSILPKADTAKTTLWFQYMSSGGVVSSDKIGIDKVIYTKATKSADLAKKLDRFKLVLDSTINGGSPVAGQDYMLRIAFRQYIGLSEEDPYWKYGMVHASAGLTPSNFYKKLALSLVKNMSRESTPLVNVYVATDSASTLVTPATKESELTGTYTNIQIEQVAQDWNLGTMPQGYIPFSVQPTTIVVDGDDRIWGTVEAVTPVTVIQNGHDIADLEYFCMGARGDMYRNMGWPNVIPTKYLVDPSQKYDTLDLTYYWAGSNEDVQRSQRTMTLVAVDDGSHTAIDALITAINAASGLNIAKLGS